MGRAYLCVWVVEGHGTSRSGQFGAPVTFEAEAGRWRNWAVVMSVRHGCVQPLWSLPISHWFSSLPIVSVTCPIPVQQIPFPCQSARASLGHWDPWWSHGSQASLKIPHSSGVASCRDESHSLEGLPLWNYLRSQTSVLWEWRELAGPHTLTGACRSASSYTELREKRHRYDEKQSGMVEYAISHIVRLHALREDWNGEQSHNVCWHDPRTNRSWEVRIRCWCRARTLSLFKKSLHSCFYTNFKIRENTKPLLKPGGIIAMEPLY